MTPAASGHSALGALAQVLSTTVPADADVVRHFEAQALARRFELPVDYVDYLRVIGRVRETGLAILGVSDDGPGGLGEVWHVVDYASAAFPAAEGRFLPLAVRPDSYWVTLELDRLSPEGRAVVAARKPTGDDLAIVTIIADDFPSFLLEQIDAWAHNRILLGEQFAQFLKLSRGFVEKHRLSQNGGGRLPAPHEWRPSVYRVQDVLLACWYWRYSRALDSVEVAGYAAAAAPELESGHARRVALLALASEASRCGTHVGVAFVRESFPEGVPRDLVDLADSAGVALSEASRGRVAASELRCLSLRLCRLSDASVETLLRLEDADPQAFDSIAQALRDGTWSAPDVDFAAALCGGDPLPLLARRDPTALESPAVDAAGSVMALMRLLSRRLAVRDHTGKDSAVPLEDTAVAITCAYDALRDAWLFSPHEEVALPWSPRSTGSAVVAPEAPLFVRGAAGHPECLAGLMPTLISATAADCGRREVPAVAVSRDFAALDVKSREAIESAAAAAGVHVLVSPFPAGALALDSARRRAKMGVSLS